MRFSSSALLLGAASTALCFEDQQVLGKPSHETQFVDATNPSSDSWYQPLEHLFGEFTSEAQATWDEISTLIPEAVASWKKQAINNLKPNNVNRKPDSEWDHVVKGADVQKIWIEGEDGTSHRKVGGKLDAYNLRVKKNDPSKLNVDTVKQYSGYLDDEEKDKHLFYWFFESRNDPKNDPVLLWLNGGPGCSSMMGLLLELGPSSITEKGTVKLNDHSWNKNASVIFLDQPVNTGYSYGSSGVSTTLAAAKDVYALLTLFFEQFPEYAKQDFHIAGESYGGHYVPAITTEILSHKDRNINIKSAAIGNGLTDEFTQYEHYRPMACGDGGYPAVVEESTCRSMDNALSRCQSLISSCYGSGSAWSCVPAALYCNNAFILPFQRTGRNVYDVRVDCEGDNLCYKEIEWITKWLNKDEVKSALGVEVSTYDSCNFDVNRDFMLQGDWMKPMHHLIPKILEEIPVLIYAGDADFICNWLGNQAWTNALEWDGAKSFSKAKIEDLVIDDKPYGKVKSNGKLTFMQIYEAGHMTPFDKPKESSDFVNRWMGGEWAK